MSGILILPFLSNSMVVVGSRPAVVPVAFRVAYFAPMSSALSAAEYRLLVEHSPVMIWRSGVDAKCDYFNEIWLAFTGRTLQQEMGDGWAEGVHPDDLDRCAAHYLDHFKRCEAFEMEYRLRRRDGVYRWIFDRGVPFTDEAGNFAGFIGSCVDVDERRRAQDAQQLRHHERLEIALAAGRLGLWEFDLSTRRLTCTEACKANHGFRPDQDVQLDPHIVEAVPTDHRGRFVDAINTAILTAGSFEIEVPNTWPDGTVHWLLVAGRVVHETTMVGVSQDLTDRRRTEQALRESEQQHRTLVEAANEGIWRLDQHARVSFLNQRMADLLKMSPAAMLGRHKWDFVFEDDAPLMRDLFHRRQQGIAEDVADIRFRRADGGEVWTLMAARPLYDDQGRFTGAVDLFTDITERRRAEQALRESDRRKDEFLAVLAHELRSPLAPIITAVKLLQAKGPPDPPLQRLRDTIFRQTMQLSTLVDDLLDVGRITAGKLRLDKTHLDLRTIVQQAVEVSAAVIERRRHALAVRLPDHPVYVEGDAARLAQVATNLLNNAARYTPEGGRIEIALHEDADHGVVTVRDEGVGIPPEMLERIFDRFVQVGGPAAGAQGGLGVGLSVVKALVDLHGGTVDARSEGIGKGSEFTFRIRLAAAPAAS